MSGLLTVAEEVCGEREFLGEIAFPDDLSGQQVEAVEPVGHAVDVYATLGDRRGGSRPAVGYVAAAEVDLVAVAPEPLAGFVVQAVDMDLVLDPMRKDDGGPWR